MNRLFDHATIGVEHLRFEPDVAESEKPGVVDVAFERRARANTHGNPASMPFLPLKEFSRPTKRAIAMPNAEELASASQSRVPRVAPRPSDAGRRADSTAAHPIKSCGGLP